MAPGTAPIHLCVVAALVVCAALARGFCVDVREWGFNALQPRRDRRREQGGIVDRAQQQDDAGIEQALTGRGHASGSSTVSISCGSIAPSTRGTWRQRAVKPPPSPPSGTP